METRKIRSRGRMTIPKAIRDECQIVAGTMLEFIPTGTDTFACRVVPTTQQVPDSATQRLVDGTKTQPEQQRIK